MDTKMAMDELSEAAFLMLKRWGKPGKESVLNEIRTPFGSIVNWSTTIQIASALQTGTGTIHIHGNFPDEAGVFTARCAVSEDWTMVEKTVLMLANFLATKDFQTDSKPGCIHVLKGVGRAMQGPDSLSRLQMLIAVLAG